MFRSLLLLHRDYIARPKCKWFAAAAAAALWGREVSAVRELFPRDPFNASNLNRLLIPPPVKVYPAPPFDRSFDSIRADLAPRAAPNPLLRQHLFSPGLPSASSHFRSSSVPSRRTPRRHFITVHANLARSKCQLRERGPPSGPSLSTCLSLSLFLRLSAGEMAVRLLLLPQVTYRKSIGEAGEL